MAEADAKVYFISKQETSDLATVNYRTIDTSRITSSEIPKYSTINHAYLGIKITSSVSITKASLKFAFSNRSGGDGSPNGTVIKDFGKVIGGDVYTNAVDMVSFIHSNDANAGKYNGSYPYFLYWSEGTLRKWTVGEFMLAYFITKPTYKITVTSNNSDWGTVSGGGTWNVETADLTKTITATPKTHYHFVRWSDGDTNASRTVIIGQNGITAHTTEKTYEAVFAPDTFTVTANTDGNGTVTGGGTYEYGKTATLTAVPNAGYKFKRWSDGNTSNPRTVTVTGAASYTAEFEAAEVKFYVYRGSARYAVKAYIGTSRVQGYIGTKRIF